MKKKGFTLLELLAVIVILAIIVLITIPMVTNIINDAKKGAFQSSAYGIIKAGELAYAQSMIDGNVSEMTFIYENGIETSSVEGKKLEYKGSRPKSGIVKISRDGKIAIALHNGVYCAQKNYSQLEVKITEKSEEDSDIYMYYDRQEKVNAPVLASGMIPIKWDEELNEIETTENDEEW